MTDRDPYIQALTWLARRELSTQQVRKRLAQRGAEPDAIDAAVERLTQERALDDRRVALAYARSAVRLKGRARSRILREIAALGIARDTAETAVREVFGDVDEGALLDQALTRRLPRGRALTLTDTQRLFRALLRQGFPSGAIAAALRAHRVNLDDAGGSDATDDPDD